MNNMCRTMKDIKIYTELLQMKVTLYGINIVWDLGTTEENTAKFEDIKKNYPKQNMRVKILKKYTEYELAMENTRCPEYV